MKIALTGASGFIGHHIKETYKDCIVIDRNDTKENILKKLDGVDMVIHLAGAPILKRWSKEYKKVIVESRIKTTNLIVEAINESDVKYFVSSSAIGAYPEGGPYDESYREYIDGFLGELIKEWEDAAKLCKKPTAITRIGIVLGKDAGALKEMLLPFKLGVGGVMADGKMVMSWIDINDVIRAYKHLYDHQFTGVFNFVAPHPVSNREFAKTLGEVLHRPALFSLPKFALKLIYGEAANVATSSIAVYPKRLLESGFQFEYPTIKESLEHLVS